MKYLKTQCILKYYISFILFFSYLSLSAQAQPKDTIVKNDTLVQLKKQPVKIRFGFDIGKYLWAYLDGNSSLDFAIDANFYKNYYVIAEFGTEEHFSENSLLTYTTNGNYFKLGVDYNLYKNWLDMDNEISVGFRYGYATYDYNLTKYTINQPDAIFTPTPIDTDQTFSNLSAHWIDLTTKIQAEIIANIYLGYTVSLKYLLTATQPENFGTLYIPGFFTKNAYGNIGFGMQYFISYQLKF